MGPESNKDDRIKVYYMREYIHGFCSFAGPKSLEVTEYQQGVKLTI